MKSRKDKIKEYRLHQPLEELKRKARKARERANLWTVEELDYAQAQAREIRKIIHWY
ncbi:hypothetical protein LCGC14_2407550 [marine sediment metagenome]|uniref:Uncharacterized protein n=1 Tax=marine sediment metagenome TaxID=412755 RepID=A0A0F9BTE7_9ZZZZ